MSEKKSISDYTEAEFLAFVKQIFNVENTTESEDIKNILLFKKLTEHPDGSDLIYYPRANRPDTPDYVNPLTTYLTLFKSRLTVFSSPFFNFFNNPLRAIRPICSRIIN
ncbi:bacteriocin immunity protein [Providencia rettgeri]|uniref:bacteriocin immunity protein n=1 Tax=Providencia rettgeri TaxID=587 RepID=UPI001419EF3C|nr:bacteriocin immunity protein [Providencia rettgeri]